MLYALEAMAPTVYNRAETLLSVFKDQLTKCWQGELKQFEYGTILATFFFKRVPLLRPQVNFTELRARDPHMLWWVEIMVALVVVGPRKNMVVHYSVGWITNLLWLKTMRMLALNSGGTLIYPYR